MAKSICSISGCERGIYARNWCTVHYTRWLRHGEPTRLMPNGSEPADFVTKLLTNYTVATTGCWLWNGSPDSDGYGRLRVNGETMRVHRLSYALHNGDLPSNMAVCHSCDTPLCVNPDHLWLGSNEDNIADRTQKRRSAAGSRNGYARLTEESVRAIRSETGVPVEDLAERFGVSIGAVYKVRSRQTWAWLD